LSQSELLSDIRFQSIGEVNSGYAG